MSSSNNAQTTRRAILVDAAEETRAALPHILEKLPCVVANSSVVWRYEDLQACPSSHNPGFELPATLVAPGVKSSRGTLVKVINAGALDTAVLMAGYLNRRSEEPEGWWTSNGAGLPRNRRVALLNMTSDRKPGGGWLKGATGQEETLFYRSSLSLSLTPRISNYPLKPESAIYSPDVVVIRSTWNNGHRLLTAPGPASPSSSTSNTTTAGSPRSPQQQQQQQQQQETHPLKPSALPVVSVISIAGIRKPEVHRRANGELAFRHETDRRLTKRKMRMALRIAAFNHHELLVLGALGCGAFGGPPDDVAACWAEVLDHPEFEGGWFREVWFAVPDKPGERNFEAFDRVLGGKVVGRVDVNVEPGDPDFPQCAFPDQETDRAG